MIEKTQTDRQIHVTLTFFLAVLCLLASTLPVTAQEPPRNPPIVKRIAEPTVDVTGHVFLEFSRDLHGILVVLTRDDGKVRFTVTDERGSYRFSDVIPGDYTIRAEALRSPHLAAELDLAIDPTRLIAPDIYPVPHTTLLTGDVTDDGIVDKRDLEAIENWWHKPCAPEYPYVDLNGDCEVNILDLTIVGARHGLREPLTW